MHVANARQRRDAMPRKIQAPLVEVMFRGRARRQDRPDVIGFDADGCVSIVREEELTSDPRAGILLVVRDAIAKVRVFHDPDLFNLLLIRD
jgi:hypothetical protein